MESAQKDFYNFIYDSLTQDEDFDKDDHHKIDSSLERNFSLWYYHAPDLGLLRKLSGERYEGKECKASLILFPNCQNIRDILSYKGNIQFDDREDRLITEKNLRLIRKHLEAVAESDYLAAAYIKDEDKKIYGYKIIGVVSKNQKDEQLDNEEYFEVCFKGALKWSMSIHCKDKKKVDLFDYSKGAYRNYEGIEREMEVVLESATENDIFKKFF